MEPRKLDPRHTVELLKHLDKQKEVLMETHRIMQNESQKLQEEVITNRCADLSSISHAYIAKLVQHEMLMHKLYEVMSAHGLVKKNEAGNSGASYDSRADDVSNKDVNEENDVQ